MFSVTALVVVAGLVYAQEPPCCTGKQWEANEYYQLGTVEGGQPRYTEVSLAFGVTISNSYTMGCPPVR